MLHAALDLARDYDLYLLPLKPPRPGRETPGETPLISHWVELASNKDTIRGEVLLAENADFSCNQAALSPFQSGLFWLAQSRLGA